MDWSKGSAGGPTRYGRVSQRLLTVFYLITWILVTGARSAGAQTFAEWFFQRSTQKKYLIKQIAALAQYGSYVREGNRILQEGWGGIGDRVLGEFNLHKAFYASLRTVNPAIRDDPKAEGMLRDAGRIALQFDGLDHLSIDAADRAYSNKVRDFVLSETEKDLQQMELVMTDTRCEMTDNERMVRLDALYAGIRNKLAFSVSFCAGLRLLINQRKSSIRDINILNNIYGIKNEGNR